MGQQQTLLVLLSLILVFVAIAVGITLYNSYLENTAKQNCMQELNYFIARTVDYYKTSKYLGGTSFGTFQWDSNSLAAYIGLGYNGTNGLETEYAVYTVTVNINDVTFLANPKEGNISNIQIDYNVQTGATTITYP